MKEVSIYFHVVLVYERETKEIYVTGKKLVSVKEIEKITHTEEDALCLY